MAATEHGDCDKQVQVQGQHLDSAEEYTLR